MDITVECRALVVIAGLPGSGKSTLLRHARANVPIAVIDTDHVRSWLTRVLPVRVPYAICRPFVHILHTVRVLITVVCSGRPVLLHDPATGGGTRFVFAAIGALTGRRRHLIFIDCTPDEALAGQVARGRVLLKWSFAKHVHRTPALRSSLLAGQTPHGWNTARLVDRDTVRSGLNLLVG